MCSGFNETVVAPLELCIDAEKLPYGENHIPPFQQEQVLRAVQAHRPPEQGHRVLQLPSRDK